MRKFKRMYIEITNVCNLDCEFCPKTERRPAFIQVDVFKKILAEIHGYTKHIYLHVLGEPLLHPKLPLLLAACDSAGIKANITTNGVLLREKGNELFASKAVRQVNISLHSFEANDKIDSLRDYLEGVFTFVDQAVNTSPIFVCLRLWNLASGKQELNKYLLDSIGKHFSLPFALETRLTEGNGITLGKNLFLQQAERFNWPDVHSQAQSDTGFCYGLRDQLGILVDGTVVPCCLDNEGIIDLGNINEKSLAEILAGKRAQEFYHSFSKRKVVEELCQKCTYRSRFE